MEQLPTPHNNFFQFALSHLPNARSLIETQLSDAALAELDLDSLKQETGNFVDPDLRERFSDLLLSAQLKADSAKANEQALVYILFEHKSQSDPLTVFQLVSYIIRIWETRLRDGLPLCPIVPLVIYHGQREWTAARSIRELMQVRPGLEEYQIDFRLQLLDLSQLSDDEITGEPVLRSTLRLLKYSRSKQLINKLAAILQLLIKSLPEDRLPNWVQAIGVYVMSVNKGIDSQQYKQTLKSVFPTQFEPDSLADRLLSQGREEGREEGREKGREEGRREAKTAIIETLRMLEELVGETPSDVGPLMAQTLDALNKRVADLQQRMRDRHS